MLLAAEADPTTCGYRERQIQTIRRDLVEKGVHQERVAVEHLASILFDKAEIAEPRIGSDKAARRREVVSLRFHSERSPIDGLPLAIREPLYDILLEHAEGALQRIGNQWVDLDLRSDPGMSAPYPFDKPPAVPSKPENTRTDQGPTSINFGELTWPEAEDRLKKVDIALLPVGAIEQHGPHLPIDTDSFDAEYIARRVAEACSEPAPVVLPLIPYGVSYHHDDFPGTLSVGNESLARYVYDVGMSAARNGIAKLIIVNGHGGNAATLHFAAQMINRDARIFTCVDTGETSDSDIFALAETSNDVHAGEIETSTSLATRPHLVKMDLAQPFVPRFSSHYLDFTSRHSVDWYARTARISESGVFGDPTKATREKGEMFLDLMIRHLVALVDHLKGLSLEEIHQQKV